MAYSPKTTEDIRIVFDATQGGFVLEQVFTRQRLGAEYLEHYSPVDRATTLIDWDSEYWLPVTPPLTFLNVIYQTFDLIWHENRRIRTIDLGPLDPNGPEATQVKLILDQVRF